MSLKIGGDVAVLAFSLLGTSMSLKIGGDVAVLASSHTFYEQKGGNRSKMSKLFAFG
jgi:hypothetical protein